MISGGRNEQLDIIAGFLPHHWLYEWFSQFQSCGTYSVLSRSHSIAFISQLKHAAANLAARLCSPIAFANNTKRSITQLSKQAQIFLIDQTSQTVVHVVLVWRGFDQCSCCWLVRWASFLFRRRRSKRYLCDSIKYTWSLCATIKQQYLCWTAQELHIHKTFTIKSCEQYAQLCMYNECTICTTMN